MNRARKFVFHGKYLPGNDGVSHSVGAPATAKNILSVGASQATLYACKLSATSATSIPHANTAFETQLETQFDTQFEQTHTYFIFWFASWSKHAFHENNIFIACLRSSAVFKRALVLVFLAMAYASISVISS